MTQMKICVDPGHGASNRRPGVYDTGAVEGGLAEADVVLALGTTLAWVLRQRGYETWMTRTSDSDPDPVGSRDDRAVEAGCDAFVSLHCNDADDKAAHGTETYYRDQRDKRLASWINSAAVMAMGTANRGLKGEDESQHTRLAVFDFPGPACLLELGFLSSPAEREKLRLILTNREYRIRIANALVSAIDGWVAAGK